MSGFVKQMFVVAITLLSFNPLSKLFRMFFNE